MLIHSLIPAAGHPENAAPGDWGQNPTCNHADGGPLVSENLVVLSEFANSHISIDSDKTEHEPHVIPADRKEISWNHNLQFRRVFFAWFQLPWFYASNWPGGAS